MLSGRQGVELSDGTILEWGPNEVYDIPPGHDGYTIGDEPAVMLEWTGIRTWIAGRGGANDRILTTILFTDLVGSTSLASELGDARWRDQLERHYSVLRNILEQHRGRESKRPATGCSPPSTAPRWRFTALAMTRAASNDRLSVRAGIHVGGSSWWASTSGDQRPPCRTDPLLAGPDGLVSSTTRAAGRRRAVRS
jgi:hypothetical protein